MALLDQDDEMRIDRFYDEKLCVLAARDHPLAAREQLDWPELLQADWVLPPADCIFYEHMRRTLLEVGLEMPRVVVEAYSVHRQYTIALHGGMRAFGPSRLTDTTAGVAAWTCSRRPSPLRPAVSLPSTSDAS